MNHFNKLYEICEKFMQLSYFINRNNGEGAASIAGENKPQVPLELRLLIDEYLGRVN